MTASEKLKRSKKLQRS